MRMPAIRLQQWRRAVIGCPEQADHAVSNRTARATRALFFVAVLWILLTTGAVAQAQFVFPRRLPEAVGTPHETNTATVAANSQATSAADLLTLDEAQRLAATQASAFQRAGISEQI